MFISRTPAAADNSMTTPVTDISVVTATQKTTSTAMKRFPISKTCYCKIKQY